MRKKLIIKVSDPDFIKSYESWDDYFIDERRGVIIPKNTDLSFPYLHPSDCPNILNRTSYTPNGTDYNRVKFDNALNTIVAHFVKAHINTLEVDISERDQRLSPVKEMTISEIEEKLGYKIKVVEEV